MPSAKKPDALPVVAHLLEESRRWKARALTTTDRAMAEREAQARNDGSTVSALVRLSDAQASLLAKEAECEALRVKAARYDWLRRWDTNLDGVLLCKTSDGNYWRHGPGLDAAIDAARAAADQGRAS